MNMKNFSDTRDKLNVKYVHETLNHKKRKEILLGEMGCFGSLPMSDHSRRIHTSPLHWKAYTCHTICNRSKRSSKDHHLFPYNILPYNCTDSQQSPKTAQGKLLAMIRSLC